jgi:hypothetical protein
LRQPRVPSGRDDDPCVADLPGLERSDLN